jgi:NAD(P)-dependent dehydrogenase (short-subunit alcohol dehydrogenase family)
MSLVSSFSLNGPSGFGYASTAEEVTAGIDLTGRTYLVTGVTSGLGQETVRVLLLRGARVVAIGRSHDKVVEALRSFPSADQVLPVACDLSDLASVALAVRTVTESSIQLDAIVLNAGIMALPKLELVNGYERQFFNNHIGHFYLGRLLTPLLAPLGRVVVLSSEAHRAAPRVGIDFDNLRGQKGYDTWGAYGRSKLANLLFALELGERLQAEGKIAHAVHPGVIQTPLNRHMSLLLRSFYPIGNAVFMKSVPEGAATQVYLATHPDVPYDRSSYWSSCNIKQPTPMALSLELRKKLWEVSTQIVNDIGPVHLEP